MNKPLEDILFSLAWLVTHPWGWVTILIVGAAGLGLRFGTFAKLANILDPPRPRYPWSP